ncbi:MAG: hypothetical protein AB8B53_11900 [Flavobacteriales bacterium]
MKTSLILLCTNFLTLCLNAQETISIDDFKILDNTSWEGTLTYLDYSSNELTDIDTKMQVKILENTFEQNIQYVWEPDKNIQAKTKIRKKGKYLGKQKVVSKMVNEDGSIKIVTTYKGKDNGKKATFYFTYEISSHQYKVIKEVQLSGNEVRFMRNMYTYNRIN